MRTDSFLQLANGKKANIPAKRLIVTDVFMSLYMYVIIIEEVGFTMFVGYFCNAFWVM